jgi:SAM-dependent methyltransferase
MSTRHLDLGCGARPRNPYGRDELHGVDIMQTAFQGHEMRVANVALSAIPYPDDHFDSVSAYDFLEHVPRVLPTPDGTRTRFPFVELMNEIWRVLRDGGLFYGYTPAYPHTMAFRDPTHVNIITDDSQYYFVRPHFLARMYGYRGDFSVVRQLRVKGGDFDYEPTEPPSLRRRLRLRRQERRGELSHLVWEWRAHKPGAGGDKG